VAGGPGDPRYFDRVAVVTGASSGLGRQLALDLADRGAIVVALARRADRLAELQPQLTECSAGSSVRVCVLRDVATEIGPVDILVNNAATDPGIRLADITTDDFRRTFEVNFFAAVEATLAVLPAMYERGFGIVANVSSDGGRLPSPGPGAYPASKAALSAFTESISFRAERHGVHCHVVYPAFMPTELGQGALERGLRRPPRLATRSEAAVSRRVLRHLGRSKVEISAARLIDVATGLRIMAPRPYHRFRRGW
jgi:short-subunit dehydrogenase